MHEATLELDESEGIALQSNPEALQSWMIQSLERSDPALADAIRGMESVLSNMPSPLSNASPSSPLSNVSPSSPPSRRTQPRAARGIPGRKWEQIQRFTTLMPPIPGHDKQNTIVDWCSGKGYLARGLHACGCCSEVHCLELDAALCAAGEAHARAKALPIAFHEYDVLGSAPLPAALRVPHITHTALHACGELHRTALRTAAAEVRVLLGVGGPPPPHPAVLMRTICPTHASVGLKIGHTPSSLLARSAGRLCFTRCPLIGFLDLAALSLVAARRAHCNRPLLLREARWAEEWHPQPSLLRCCLAYSTETDARR